VSKAKWTERGIMPKLLVRHIRHALGLPPLPVLVVMVRA